MVTHNGTLPFVAPANLPCHKHTLGSLPQLLPALGLLSSVVALFLTLIVTKRVLLREPSYVPSPGLCHSPVTSPSPHITLLTPGNLAAELSCSGNCQGHCSEVKHGLCPEAASQKLYFSLVLLQSEFGSFRDSHIILSTLHIFKVVASL